MQLLLLVQKLKHILGCLIISISLFSNLNAQNSEWVDVSHSWGIPFGGLGNGYSVLGKYGFIKVNFNGIPDRYNNYPSFDTKKNIWDSSKKPDKEIIAPFGFVLIENSKKYIFQENVASWINDAQPFDKIKAYAFLPEGKFSFEKKNLDLDISMVAFTPLIPHDIATSTTPIQVYDITFKNRSAKNRELQLLLTGNEIGKSSENKVIFNDDAGQIAFAADGGKANAKGVTVNIKITPGTTKTVRFYLAWYYPKFNHIKPARRYYTKSYNSAQQVIEEGMKMADYWHNKIESWHNSYQVPVYFKRLWFSSLSSVMTSSLLGDEPSFYELETPHSFLNTMDVVCYSGWAYLINWPELEQLDMNQYFKSIPTFGNMAGFVWHSAGITSNKNDTAQVDIADYVEEPTYLTRLYRDYLWFNDTSWIKKGFPLAVLAANRVYYEDGYDYLINSKHGNQSYDLWKMPGIGSYVNSPWIFGLYGLEKLSEALKQPVTINGMPLNLFCKNAVVSYNHFLWNDSLKCWNCFYRTLNAVKGGNPSTIFTDQLFGKWMLAIDPEASNLLSNEKVAIALNTIYNHNLVDNGKFRGWINGLLPNGKIDTSGYHAYTFWLGAQLNMGSLLGLTGNETASLDVIMSVEKSLANNHLAVGEWNQSIDKNNNVITLPNEPGKDTPRFPAYPRYKSSWEYLIRILGLQMDRKYLYFKPFSTISFSINDVTLAGVKLSISVEPGWNNVLINGTYSGEKTAKIDRFLKDCKIEFIK